MTQEEGKGAAARQPRSLQSRLLLNVLGLAAVVWLVAVVATWVDTRHELKELLDAHLAQTAALLLTHATDDLNDEALSKTPTLHKYQARVAFQVWHKGQLVARSAEAPKLPLSDRTGNALGNSEVEGRAWRVFTAQGSDPDLRIHVGELQSARRDILLANLRSVIWPMLLALPLLVVTIWWAVRDAVGPLRELGRNVAARRPHALDPLPSEGITPEVAPLVTALNELFARVSEQMASERRFTADAAHELRTPIAAIRMQAQVAQGAATQAERVRALDATLQGCDRATRLVEQLLQLARLEAEAQEGADAGRPRVEPQVNLTALARQLLVELAPLALERRQELVLEAPDALSVPMNGALASVLLRNLVDNALRYSPDGATVQVRLTDGPEAELAVEDSGPGMPPEALERLGERFFRVLGTGQPGSGLGWSIVRRLSRLYGLKVEVDRSPTFGGLRVRVRWPAAVRA